MGFFGITSVPLILALIAYAHGKPTTDKAKIEEIKQYRHQVKLMREVRPCFARLLEVKTDIAEFNEIKSDPHYVPECEITGKKWRAAQCDHHDEGACFCVHEENGEVLEHSRELNLNKEALGCGRRAENTDHSGHECFHMQDEFTHMQREFGLTGHSPLQYYPECTLKGKFMAMQRNDRSQFFCVDTDTGDIIPETETSANSLPPLTENICLAYDEIWKEFKKWNSTHDNKEHSNEVTPGSCGVGFKYTECGCPVVCTSSSNTDSFKEECTCKPACLCPKGMLELNGKCISLEECHEANPKTKVPQAEKLDDLTAGRYGKWKEYMEQNPNAVLETFNSLEMEEMQRMNYASGPIAYDENPSSQFFRMRPLPVEGEETQFGYFGAEEIEGSKKPYLRLVLSEGGLNGGEEEEYSSEQIEENTNTEAEIEVLNGNENQVPYYQLEGSYPVEENYPTQEQNWEGLYQEETYEEEENSHEEPEEEEYYPTEATNQQEEYNQNEYGGEYTSETHEWYPKESEEYVTESPSNKEEEQEEEDQEEEHQYPYFEASEFDSEEEIENTPSNEENPQNEEEAMIHHQEEYEEREEPENEIDDRLINRILAEYVGPSRYTSVPTEEEEQENHEAPPCDEEESEEPTPTDPTSRMHDTESAEAVIDRLLPPIEATLENDTPSVKKNMNG